MSFDTTNKGDVHVRGDFLELSLAVASAAVIKVGDLVKWDDGNENIAAIEDYWNSSESVSQAAIKASFIGVAMDPSAAGSTDEIRIAGPTPAAVFRFTITSATVSLGDMVSVEKKSGNGMAANLLQVAALGAATQAGVIGRVVGATTFGSAVTEALVVFHSEILSVPMPAEA